MTIDLAELDTSKACEEGAEIELVHPVTREPLGQFITIVGKDSKTFRNYVAKASNAERRREFEAKRRNRPVDPKTFEEMQDDGIALLVYCTKSFRNIMYRGKLITIDEAYTLYSEQSWIKDQVDGAIVDLENFMKG